MDLRSHIAAGAGVWWGQAGAEPTPLVDALLDAAIPDVRAFCGLSFNPRLGGSDLALLSYGALGALRTAPRLEIVPCAYSTLPRLFAEGRLPRDVGFVQVAPPRSDGTCSMGIGVDYAADALAHTRVLIAEINHRMPVTDAPGIARDRFAAVVETDRPLTPGPSRDPDEVDLAIAGHVAELVRDGDTIQIGVGPLPSAVLEDLAGHRDLGFHGGMITEGVLRLVEKGVLTGAYKEIDPGVVVTGTAMGGPELYGRIAEMPVSFRPASYTHSAAVLARLRTFVSINSAVEVDLTGQVGAEVRRGRHVGAVGGQGDFSAAAARTGARSIILLRSRIGADSAIVAALRGPVTTARSDVDVVVTEYGAAHLRGCPLSERPQRLAAVAAPEHRDTLLEAR